jgi:lipopolysaccharide export system permease protein
MRKWKLTIIDFYIIKKFLGTFFYALLLIISISVIFDMAEKLDDFLEKGASAHAIIFDYYLNFIPYFAVLFSSLFTFIAVIFFTSKMAYDTEIVAILGCGVSFRRMMYPYFISALFLALFSFFLSSYVIPKANQKRFIFEEKYIHSGFTNDKHDIHKQIQPGVFIYMETFNTSNNVGYKFSMEKYKGQILVSKLMSNYIQWDSTKNKWIIHEYYIRTIHGMHEKITKGATIDTTLNIQVSEFKRRDNFVEAMTITELRDYIKTLQLQGADNISLYIIEMHKRLAYPFSMFILTLIGVTLSSRKVKGGIGMHIGLGLGLSFGYILFMQFSSQFAINGSLSPILAAWLPNILFTFISLYLYRLAPK